MLPAMKRLECLDGLRGALAVYVLIGHMAPFAALPAWAQSLVSHGSAAVDIFFMLSGLVITESLQAYAGKARPFLIARGARIFPAFLPVFAVAVVVEPLSCGFEAMPWISDPGLARGICTSQWPRTWLPEIAAHLTMTHGLFPYAVLPSVWVSFLGAAWSLSAEWQFYVLALLVTKIAGSRRCAAAGPELLTWVLIAMAAGGAIWRFSAPEPWQFSRAFLPNKAQYFALGVASVGVVRARPGAAAHYIISLAACVALSLAGAPAGKAAAPIVWTLCLMSQSRPWLVTRVLRCGAMQWLGSASYCIYLVNEPVQKLLANLLTRCVAGDAVLFTVGWIPAAVAVPVILAAWLHRRVESPALRWGRGLARRIALASTPDHY